MPVPSPPAALARRAIVAMGVSGCGKTTMMHHLATRLGCAAFEGDAFHGAANVAKMRGGHPLDDADRWPWLDRLGAAIGAAVRDDGIAVAACSALKRDYRQHLGRVSGVPLLFVLLDGERATIAERLAARAGHYMPASLLDSQFATLERPAPDECALVLPCGWPVERLAEAVLQYVGGDAASHPLLPRT
ncbi:gluconokinase [Sphingomonas sp. Leaf24]|nr:gluconokinase [Sphingomonas sp. Leaf5]KQM95884.1 gluconokinase [Sphingomonas sp. Leaf24]